MNISDWEIRKYDSDKRAEWNSFVKTARNATFLFERDFMDYHSDRFEDCSLMAYRKGKLRAILPAERQGKKIRSHGGLTYGGWVLPSQTGIDGSETLKLWREWIRWAEENGVSEILYKPLPYIYARQPSEEDIYCLFRSGAIMRETGLSSVIRLAENPGLNKLQKRHLRSLTGTEFEIKNYYGEVPPEKLREFYEMLELCLEERHEAKAVHSQEEIAYLSSKFPENISLNTLEHEGKIAAGIWLFKTDTCHHCQYIATTPLGREKNLLTPLSVYLIDKATKEEKNYFDFGTSNEDHGRFLNEGLNRHKSSLGGTGVAYTQWLIDVEKALTSL